MSKSYVSIAQNQCPVCSKIFATGEILLDKRIKNSLEKFTLTGFSLCEEHKVWVKEGYVILIEVSNQESEQLKPEKARRTGKVNYLAKEAFPTIFPAPEKGWSFCSIEVMGYLEGLIS